MYTLTLGCSLFVSNPLPSGIKNSEVEDDYICRDFRLREDRDSSQHFAVDVEPQTCRHKKVTSVTGEGEWLRRSVD